MNFLNGKKTYLLAIGFTAYAIFGWYTGSLDANAAIQIIMDSGLGATIRHGIAAGQ